MHVDKVGMGRLAVQLLANRIEQPGEGHQAPASDRAQFGLLDLGRAAGAWFTVQEEND
jgi:hypothetical protein